ncbi:MAG: pyruvate dehydrogenase E1 component, partial [Porticoccus sp.]
MTHDVDPLETQEWLEAFDSVYKVHGEDRVAFLLNELQAHASSQSIKLPSSVTTPFHNTISPPREKRMPGDLLMERRIRSLVRW